MKKILFSMVLLSLNIVCFSMDIDNTSIQHADDSSFEYPTVGCCTLFYICIMRYLVQDRVDITQCSRDEFTDDSSKSLTANKNSIATYH